ncbi:TetR/AcrR family transcriptional regulator [Glycomyces sp. TRM65418]|uniref:TetR/AcrR family transcriptional regulator n=1 Tax=Glycomyces sp. TRM65418 TaxID=2867006 RepID=UPI001CE6C4D0|nr:TetR/AcrR family transcriptional regulator [Glycomyces sp. TRM65418]MCC3761819.1 TetR/AcrR family transcriptional regulator [Glycomyces sp. TRM65418]QZD55902.1 TetR/AcrR family transcriptional regulator [Glycomyces sp. TRM65418]
MADGKTTASARRPSGQRRADAQRSIDKILAAGLELYSSRPGVSVAEVAEAAGVGRVTLYGHFPSRTELAQALIERAFEETEAAWRDVDTSGAADEALARILRRQWNLMERNRNLRDNVVGDLSPQWLRERHDPILRRIEALLTRGQDDGVFRTDLPLSWMVTALYSLVHAASDEISAGRLTAEQAPEVLVASLGSLYRA